MLAGLALVAAGAERLATGAGGRGTGGGVGAAEPIYGEMGGPARRLEAKAGTADIATLWTGTSFSGSGPKGKLLIIII